MNSVSSDSNLNHIISSINSQNNTEYTDRTMTDTCNRKYKYGQFWTNERLPGDMVMCLKKNNDWYTPDLLERIIIPRIPGTGDRKGKSTASARILDWLVTNYSKKNDIRICKDLNSAPFNIHSEYKSTSAMWKRARFDPFRRGVKTKNRKHKEYWVYFECNGKVYQTKVGQLNFLRWADQNGVLAYAEQNKDQIAADMNITCKKHKHNKLQNNQKQKRSELSQAAGVSCSIYTKPVTMQLDMSV